MLLISKSVMITVSFSCAISLDGMFCLVYILFNYTELALVMGRGHSKDFIINHIIIFT